MKHLQKNLQKNFCVSERRACRVVDQPRSSQRYLSMKADKDAALTQRMVADTEDGRFLHKEPALRLPEGMGTAEERRLDSEQEACPEVVEGSGFENLGQ